jgi:uncharacterized protein with PQ loop repeat
MSEEGNSKGLSITTVTIIVAVVVTWLLWGVACAMYSNAHPAAVEGHLEVVVDTSDNGLGPTRMGTRGASFAFVIAGISTFFLKTFQMLPQLPSVLGYLFRERIGFVIVANAILAGIILFGVFMKRLELQLEAPKTKRKKKRPRPPL